MCTRFLPHIGITLASIFHLGERRLRVVLRIGRFSNRLRHSMKKPSYWIDRPFRTFLIPAAYR